VLISGLPGRQSTGNNSHKPAYQFFHPITSSSVVDGKSGKPAEKEHVTGEGTGELDIDRRE